MYDLYYYRARYYDPNSGRFISSDPIEFMAGDFNFYRYVGNNPVNFRDAFGYQRCPDSKKKRIAKGLNKARKAQNALNVARLARSGIRAAAVADLSVLEPSDFMPWKWVGEAVILAASEAAFALLESRLTDPKELAKLEAEDKDCKKREREAEKKETEQKGGEKVEKKVETCKKEKKKKVDKFKGDCAECLVKKEQTNPKNGYKSIDGLQNGRGNGLDLILTKGNELKVMEIKATTVGSCGLASPKLPNRIKGDDGFPKASQRDGGEAYTQNTIDRMSSTESYGFTKQKILPGFEANLKKLNKLFSDEDVTKTYKWCCIKLKNDPTNCYGHKSKTKCGKGCTEESRKCFDWDGVTNNTKI